MAEKSLTELARASDALITEFSLPVQFSEVCLQEAKSLPAAIAPQEIERRRDLRSCPFVTIDGETARDFDDAVNVEVLGNGKTRLYVAIADVSHYVTPGSAIDKEAYARATSVYFPNRVLPMLPERLSNDLCSLVPCEDRLTMTAEMDFDPQGKRQRMDFYPSIIRSTARLTYTQVAQNLSRDYPVMEALFQRLRERRMQRGSLDFDLPEPEIIMDLEESQIETIVKAHRTPAHMLIEEFMIAANEAVAEYLTACRSQMIYRIHELPPADKLYDLQQILHNIGYPLKISKKNPRPEHLAAVVARAHDKPAARLINTLILRTLAKARYAAENAGHFGLASECYTHFTSPIRRYPDLIVHRLLKAQLNQEKSKRRPHKVRPARADRSLVRAAEHCSVRERSAMEAEWAMRDLLVAHFMKERIGQSYAGVISGVMEFGFFVELKEYFVEGMVHVKHLKDDYYRYVPERHLLQGRRRQRRFQIGDPLTVKVLSVNIEKRWVDFTLASPDVM